MLRKQFALRHALEHPDAADCHYMRMCRLKRVDVSEYKTARLEHCRIVILIQGVHHLRFADKRIPI